MATAQLFLPTATQAAPPAAGSGSAHSPPAAQLWKGRYMIIDGERRPAALAYSAPCARAIARYLSQDIQSI